MLLAPAVASVSVLPHHRPQVIRRHVLIFHQAALGDFVVTWPIAVALGRMFPQSRISYVTHASKGQLASRVIGVEEMDAEQGWHLLHAEDAQLPEANARTLAGAHMIVSFASNADDAWEHNVRRYAPEATLIRLKTNPVDDAPVNDPELPPMLQNHITAVLVSQLASAPMVQAGVRQILRSVVMRGLPVGRSHDGVVVIHPGAGKPEKCWPVERFVKLAEKLKRKRVGVRVLLGEAEMEKWPHEAIEKISAAADVQKPATYVDLLNQIVSSSVFVGNDSGPAHLAGIIGVPTVALFGTSPDRWKPIGPKVTIIRRDSLDAITVDDVLRAVSG
jgi:heptosyltransferase-3